MAFALLDLGGYGAIAHVSGGAFPTLGLPLGGDEGELRRTVLSFWEDIQFMNFAPTVSYHSPDAQAAVDIACLIERLFRIKPEAGTSATTKCRGPR